MKKIKTIFIEDKDNYFNALSSNFNEKRNPFSIISRYKDGASFLKAFNKTNLRDTVDLLVIDYQLPLINGDEVVKSIRKEMPNNFAIVGMSYFDDPFIELSMIKSGANGFFLKSDDLKIIIDCMLGAVKSKKQERRENN